jgi:hypothetical protein
MAPSGIRERDRKVCENKPVFRRDRPGHRKTPGGFIRSSEAVKQRALFNQGIEMVGDESEHSVQMTDCRFRVAPLYGDSRKQQKDVCVAIAVLQQLQIPGFGLLKISAGMMGRSALEERKEKWRSLAVGLIGCHVPAFTLDGCGEKQHPKKGLSKIRLRIAAFRRYRRSPGKLKPTMPPGRALRGLTLLPPRDTHRISAELTIARARPVIMRKSGPGPPLLPVETAERAANSAVFPNAASTNDVVALQGLCA